MHNTLKDGQTRDLEDIHSKIRALYQKEYPEGAPHLYESLLTQLPSYTRALVRRKLNLIVHNETDEKKSFEKLKNGDKEALRMFLDPQVLRAHLEVGRDSALSNHNHSIAHFDTQPPIVAHQLIKVAAGENPDSLTRMGCVFFDVDGTKTLVDCTSHSHTGKYLESLAEFLCKPPEKIKKWLKERNLRTEAYTVAGDEFIVVLQSDTQPIEKEILDAFGLEIQTAIAEDAHLTSFISFDDPDFVMEYDVWTDEEKAAYMDNPISVHEKLMDSRRKLPEKFMPSVSCGSATLLEALKEALSLDTEAAKTVEELGINAFRLMVHNADTCLKNDKRKFRAEMTDVLWKAFLLRNAENRELLRQLELYKNKFGSVVDL